MKIKELIEEALRKVIKFDMNQIETVTLLDQALAELSKEPTDVSEFVKEARERFKMPRPVCQDYDIITKAIDLLVSQEEKIKQLELKLDK